jgi:hypothetical protein
MVNQLCYFGSADKVMGICLEEKTLNLAGQVDSPPQKFPAHDALRFCEFLVKKSITKMDHHLTWPPAI